MQVPEVLLQRADGVATITLNSPATRNALSDSLREQLVAAVRAVRQDQAVRAVVLTGAGGSFCAGGDLRGIAASELGNAEWQQHLSTIQREMSELITLDKPVIAAVDGGAYGAGFGLALMADMILVTPRTRLSTAFMRVGLGPDFGTSYTLPRFVGVPRAKELLLSARDVGAEEAKAIGIAMAIVPPEELLAHAQRLAASFVGASATAVRLVKAMFQSNAHSQLASALDAETASQTVLFGTEAYRNAVRKFIQKELPDFRWPG